MILWRWVMLHLVKWSDLFCSFVLGGLFLFCFFLLDCFYDHNHTLSCIFVGDELVKMEVKDRTSALKVVRCTLKRWDQVKIKLIKCKPIAFYESVIHKCFFICAWFLFHILSGVSLLKQPTGYGGMHYIKPTPTRYFNRCAYSTVNASV